jgi:inward rectifier potassium channel
MALLKRINNKVKAVDNTGFGTNSNMYGGRFFRKDGRPNLRKVGIPFLERISWYHTMLAMPRWKFLAVIFISYLIINLLFASIYLIVGVDKLSGIAVESKWEKIGEAFFFSAQTFTTVGYGRLSPTGFLMSFIASSEALIGLLSFAVATGLLYGRFSQPHAYIKFSHNAVIAPYRNTVALMLRLAPYKNNNLSEAEVKLTLAMIIEEDGKTLNKFYPLQLEIDKVNSLSLNWTLVHAIDENSALYGLSKEDLINARAEALVFFKAFDDSFSNTVMDRTSYRADEIVFGAAFNSMYHRDEKHGSTVLDLSLLNSFHSADISFSSMIKLSDNATQTETATA